MARIRSKPSRKPATAHTGLINDPLSMWEKLVWDVEVFRDIQVSYPEERQPLAYAAINVCIAAWSLAQWVFTAAKRASREQGVAFSDGLFWADVHRIVPEQAKCEAIADTAKHSKHEDKDWPGGEVRIDWIDGDEDEPPGWHFRHVHDDGREGVLALSTFQSLCNNWWRFLVEHGYAVGNYHTPRWLNNKLARMFGDRPPYVGKSEG
ncbi:hypothetical protein JNB88_05865 [Rhizobium cauense]|uniref:hypothetical protein n=1 Tax=Rhizobium cauense TaxID=1166683 RepID=UPI001C6E727B|nr:hypothetical protein [Rhizobium cauense]MBW9113174.1 hypothetical protein [Rhizobium cauense]